MFTTNEIIINEDPISMSQERSHNLIRDYSNSEKRRTIGLLRQMSTCQALYWQTSFQKFLQTISTCNNVYSLFITLFQMSQDPLWRNRASHICAIIQKLHNLCIDTYGNYLTQLQRINKYHSRLINIFYLNDQQLQQHFKNLIKIYLNENTRYGILNEQEVSYALVDAAKTQKINEMPEYLWIVSQIRMGDKAVAKVLKIAQDCLNSDMNDKLSIILPTLTILNNYVYHQNRVSIINDLLENSMFQNILVLSLQTTSSLDICREALLLCNNILAKSVLLAQKILSSGDLMNAGLAVDCEEQSIFRKLVSIRRVQLQGV